MASKRVTCSPAGMRRRLQITVSGDVLDFLTERGRTHATAPTMWAVNGLWEIVDEAYDRRLLQLRQDGERPAEVKDFGD